jgi:hypothetical protein
MKEFTCPLCKHSWIPKTDSPAACPRCKQYLNKKKPKEKQDKPVDEKKEIKEKSGGDKK